MLCSVIITNHNYATYLESCIQSVLEQDLNAIEIIVIDDGSTDDSRSILSKYSDKIIIIEQENLGACIARNRGLDEANGHWVKFLDSDDWLESNCLNRQITQAIELGRDRRCSIFGDVSWYWEKNERTIHTRYPQEGATLQVEDVVLNAPLTSAPLHSREDLLEIGGFDGRVLRGQEHDLHVRMALNGVEFVHRPGVAYFYRQHQSANRISEWSNTASGRSMLDATLRHIERAERMNLISEGGNGLKLAFAKRLWRQGRESLQRGARDVGLDCFAEAKRLNGKEAVYGGSMYRVMQSFLGPLAAERLSAFGRSAKSYVHQFHRSVRR